MTIGSPGRGNPRELHTHLTWHFDLPEPGRIIARLGQVCSGARLRITVDDQIRLDRALAARGPGQGPWKSAHHLDQSFLGSAFGLTRSSAGTEGRFQAELRSDP